MKSLFRILTSTAIAAVGLLAASAQTARADEHILVVLDTTGSMSTTSIPGMTRLQVAQQRLVTFLSAAAPADNEYSLWFFEGNTYHPIYTFADHRTRTDLIAAVNAATLGGATPLAHSVCAAVDELINYKPNEFHPKRIVLETDGEENNSPTTDQCFGPPSTTVYPTLDAGSWQWKVRNKACTGDANTPGLCAGGIPPGNITLVVDVDLLFDFIPFQASAAARLEPGRLTRDLFAAVAASAPNSDAAFFGGLSNETKGHFSAITPSTPPAQAAPIPGDANLDGCVNVQDRALVLQQFGTAGNGTDFNHDGVVNTFDLQTVLQNFGHGCH